MTSGGGQPPAGDAEDINMEEIVRGINPNVRMDPEARQMIGNLTSNPAIVEMLRQRMAEMQGASSGYIESLPPQQRRRIEFLRELQAQHDELEEQFEKEREELEQKYLKLYEPLYAERSEIVTGKKEAPPPAAGEEAAAAPAADDQDGEAEVEAGVPSFWLNVLRTSELQESITDKDEPILEHLIDIQTEYLDGEDETGFRLIFTFSPNPYFTNEKLTKTYHMADDEEPILEKAVGTDIAWQAGKNPTMKLMRKKPKKGAKPGTKAQTKLEPTESFFNFFNPPKVPETEDELGEEEMEKLQEALEEDYEMGEIIRDKLVPHAVYWYTGEAVQDDDDEDEDYEEDEDEDDDEDDDDDDDEDDEEDEPVAGKKKAPTDSKEQPPECKQQ